MGGFWCCGDSDARCFGFGVGGVLGVFRKVALLRGFPGAGFELDCLVINWIVAVEFTLFGVWWLVFGFCGWDFGFRVCGLLWVSGFY